MTPPPSSSSATPAPTRDRTVVCDLSDLSVLSISGADAATFLQGQLSSDVRQLAVGAWQPTTYSSPKGRLLANFLLWRAADGYRALCPASLAEALRKRLSMFVLRAKVVIADASPGLRRLGVAGPGAEARVREALGEAPAPRAVSASGDVQVLGLAADRFVVLGPEAQGDATARRLAGDDPVAPYGVWEWLAIRAGEPLVTPATQDQFVLQTANLDALGAVSFDKGCYTGQEIVARTQYLGRLKERLFGYHVEGGDAAPGAKLYSPLFGDQACGTVVNSTRAPEGGTDLLAVVQISAAEGELRLGGPEGPLLTAFALPYPLPAATAPRRLA